MTATCQWGKDLGLTCSEPVWNTTEGLCILHSRNPQKDLRQFNSYIETKLAHEDFNFSQVFFPDPADFSLGTLNNAHFFGAQFMGRVNFARVEFTGDGDFRVARFAGAADFSSAKFAGIANFIGATFEQPARVRFYQVNKDSAQGLRARFRNCDGIEGVRFEDVYWHRQRGRMVLQDELDVREGKSKDYELVAIAYRRLVNNFEKVRAYDLAEDCFCGAMEMRRLDPAEPLFRRAVVTLYRWASYYGSSYQRAFCVLLIFLLLFAAFFVQAGLRPYGAPASAPDLCGWKALWAGFVHSLQVATFQRITRYVTSGDFGQLVAVLENILMPAQLALLLLALRRRFRR